MGAVLTTAFPGAGGSQKRVRPQRAHFYPSCFFDVLRLSSVLLCLSSKAKETRANYLSFFAFIFPPRVFLQSCVALRRAGAARHGQVKKNNQPCLIPKTPTSHGSNACNKSDRERGREEGESAVRGGGARAARTWCVHANARDAHARVVELESPERDEDRQHTTLEQCMSPPTTAPALSWAVLTSTDHVTARAIISRRSSHPLPADRSPRRLPL